MSLPRSVKVQPVAQLTVSVEDGFRQNPIRALGFEG